jgi:hypothetical protein
VGNHAGNKGAGSLTCTGLQRLELLELLYSSRACRGELPINHDRKSQVPPALASAVELDPMPTEFQHNPPAPSGRAIAEDRANVMRTVSVGFTYRLHFSRRVFDPENPLLSKLLRDAVSDERDVGAAVVIDRGVADAWPSLVEAIGHILAQHEGMRFDPANTLIVPGGEAAKNDPAVLEHIIELIDHARLCRHSYMLAVGGGAVLDVAGYAAAIAHRGVREMKPSRSCQSMRSIL